MTVQTALQRAAKQLQPKHILCEADRNLGRLEAEILLAHVLKRDRAWLLAHASDELQATSDKQLHRLVSRRKRYEPIAYITGKKEFYGLPFNVNRNVLIPRPETELLVDVTLDRVRMLSALSHADVTIWDIGTGSGCIAIAIAKHLPRAQVFATDISSAALKLARQNARLNHVNTVTFLKANLLDITARRPSIITANLPYLPIADTKKLDPTIVKYEPRDALFAGKTGLEIIEKFLKQLAACEVHFTSVFLEFDPPQSRALRAIAKKLFPRTKTKIYTDLAGRNRVLEITSSPSTHVYPRQLDSDAAQSLHTHVQSNTHCVKSMFRRRQASQ